MNEIQIKKKLVQHIIETIPDSVLGSEVAFQFGSRRADVVLLEGEKLIAYEIKGAGDSVARLDYQVKSYIKFFDYCYIVCELSNIASVRASIPRAIGIILVTEDGVKQVRQSKCFKKLDKLSLSSVLSVQKLNSLYKPKIKPRSKFDLCKKVSKFCSTEQLRLASRHSFLERYKSGSDIMKREASYTLHSDDILTITRLASSHLKRK